jgi:hypothetical protein
MSVVNVMTAADFSAHIGELFQPAGAEVALELVKVEAQPQGFLLLFQGPYKRILPEGIYDFTVAGSKNFTFHVMPIHTPVPGHQDYQAVFN